MVRETMRVQGHQYVPLIPSKAVDNEGNVWYGQPLFIDLVCLNCTAIALYLRSEQIVNCGECKT